MNFSPVFCHLIEILLHVLKNEVQNIILSDYFFQFDDVSVIQFP